MPASATTFDLAGSLTDLAREAHAKARSLGLVLLYDYEGPLNVVESPES